MGHEQTSQSKKKMYVSRNICYKYIFEVNPPPLFVFTKINHNQNTAQLGCVNTIIATAGGLKAKHPDKSMRY